MKIKVFASYAIESCFLAGMIKSRYNLSKRDRAIVVRYARDNDVALDWDL